MGARNVLVSRGKDGALLLEQTGAVHKVGCAEGELISSVGCGDSMVAGFLAGYLKTKDFAYALRLGTACGSAAAFSEGVAEKEDIEKLMCIGGV